MSGCQYLGSNGPLNDAISFNPEYGARRATIRRFDQSSRGMIRMCRDLALLLDVDAVSKLSDPTKVVRPDYRAHVVQIHHLSLAAIVM
jgi:hypothetical protein